MKDFRTHRKPIPLAAQRAGLVKRLILIQTVGAPLFFGAVVSGLAYFGQTALIPVLADRQTALLVLAVCGAGLAVEALLTIRTILELNSLKKRR